MKTLPAEDLPVRLVKIEVPSGTLQEALKPLVPWFSQIFSARIMSIPGTKEERVALLKELGPEESDHLIIVRQGPMDKIEFIGPRIGGLPALYPFPAALVSENGHRAFPGSTFEHVCYVANQLKATGILAFPSQPPKKQQENKP